MTNLIATRNGKQLAPKSLLNLKDCFVHRQIDGDAYTITHKETGYRIRQYKTLAQARTFARAYQEIENEFPLVKIGTKGSPVMNDIPKRMVHEISVKIAYEFNKQNSGIFIDYAKTMIWLQKRIKSNGHCGQ